MIEDDGKTVEDLLESQDKGCSEAQGILSRLFRLMLLDFNVNVFKWNRLMNNYLNDPRNRVPRTPKARSSTRGNLSKELRKPKMTWSNFEKGIKFLNPLKAEFTVKLTWRTGKVTTHSFVIHGNEEGEDAESINDTKRSK